MTLKELLASWDVNGTDIKAVVKLARLLSREAVRYSKSSVPRAWDRARQCRNDASDLLDYARELKLRHVVKF